MIRVAYKTNVFAIYDKSHTPVFSELDWLISKGGFKTLKPTCIAMCNKSLNPVFFSVFGWLMIRAFLRVHKRMTDYDIGIKWSPGHMGIEGNEAADQLADQGAPGTKGLPSQPTVAGIGTTARQLARGGRTQVLLRETQDTRTLGDVQEALTYLSTLLANPDRFQEYLRLTRFYSEVCTR